MKFAFKFGKREHLQALLNGNIRFMSLQYYKDFKSTTGKSGIGDNEEARILFNEHTKAVMYCKELSDEPVAYGQLNTVDMNISLNKPIFSCLIIKEKQMIRKRFDNSGTFSYKLSKSIKTNLKKDFHESDSVLFIVHFEEFLKRIHEKLKSMELSAISGEIKYDNSPEKGWGKLLDIINQPIEEQLKSLCYSKVSHFSHQQEHRILIYNKELSNHSEPFYLDIDPINDIAFIIDKASFFGGDIEFHYRY